MAQFSATDPDRATPRRPRRGWLQFGFATLLKLVALAAVLSAWWADRERLTDRIGRLENDQTVLRIAMGDEVDYTPINRSLGYVGAGAIIGRPVSAYPTTTSPPAANGPSPGTTLAPVACFGEVETSSRDLYVVLHRHKDWLKANFAEDRGWQEFLAKGEPAETAGDSDAPQVEIDAIHATAIKQSLPAVVKLLAANPPHARLQAATLLGRMGAAAAPAAPALAAAANDPDQGVRQCALSTLACLGPAAKEAAPRLDALLRVGDAHSHPVEVAEALVAIDPHADVVPHLVQALSDQEPEIRLRALGVLSSLDRSRAVVAAPVIAALIADEDPEARVEAVTTYSRLVDRRDAIPLLQTALRDEADPGVKRHLARTIVRLQNGPLDR